MALPYPNMDFTALDVLHAADLDKMVANTEWLNSNKLENAVAVSQADFITANEGYTIESIAVHKTGNIVIGQIGIKVNSGTFGTVQVIPANVKSEYRPAVTYVGVGGFGPSQYFPNSLGRFAIGTNGNIFVRDMDTGDSSTRCYASFCYVV